MLSGRTRCVWMHRTGVQSYSPACKFRNYKLTATQAANKYKLVALQAWKTTSLPTLLCFFSSFFPFLLCLFLILTKKHKRLAPHRHRTVQNLLPIFFKWNTSLTPYRHDETDACRHTGNKTINLSPHRRNTKLQACRPTGVIQTTSLPPHRRDTKQRASSLQPHRRQNFFFAFFFHRHNTNYKLAAPQA